MGGFAIWSRLSTSGRRPIRNPFEHRNVQWIAQTECFPQRNAQRETAMDQKFVYHPLNRTNAPRARAASAKLVVSEYLAYVTMLSAAVVIAIITFTYAANLTVHWLGKVSGPEFFSSEAQPAAASVDKAFTPIRFAMAAPDHR
jgi:hypothetical protein